VRSILLTKFIQSVGVCPIEYDYLGYYYAFKIWFFRIQSEQFLCFITYIKLSTTFQLHK